MNAFWPCVRARHPLGSSVRRRSRRCASKRSPPTTRRRSSTRRRRACSPKPGSTCSSTGPAAEPRSRPPSLRLVRHRPLQPRNADERARARRRLHAARSGRRLSQQGAVLGAGGRARLDGHNGQDLDGKTIATPGARFALDAGHLELGRRARRRFASTPEIRRAPDQRRARRHRACTASTRALMNDTALSTALAAGTVRILAPAMDAIAPEFPYSGWFTTTDWAAKHRDRWQAFARVMAESTAYTNAHHAETAAMLADFTGQTLDAVEHSNRPETGTVLRLSRNSAADRSGGQVQVHRARLPGARAGRSQRRAAVRASWRSSCRGSRARLSAGRP